jgi:hypothetical protein
VEEWEGRKLHYVELHNLYASSNTFRVTKARRTRWVRHVVWMGEMSTAYSILAEKPESKRLLGRTSYG